MYKVEVELKNETGLHARPASVFVKEASGYSSEIFVIKDEKTYNGKSIMGILSMGAGKGDKIILQADGEDEKEAVEALKSLIENNFGE
ncbi:HPr family phosphocarrier protein [Sporosalibacterium faouarense]|uniref:HPr family phosphocarrier protein n=1 Tax=Sporosalibacterium faouarense TaxID=516123 RepID=UPI00141CA824|nr:HPr family phosphocarrier protein [Sporosalibacterium faouarense]MTI47549.1 HPr family phosphocarrier protein [Bacillota bacterium]